MISPFWESSILRGSSVIRVTDTTNPTLILSFPQHIIGIMYREAFKAQLQLPMGSRNSIVYAA
jgi:hypothetical protein